MYICMLFHPSLASQGSLPPHQRPWQSAIDPLTSSVNEELVFPTDEEDDGMAQISWRGPPAVVNIIKQFQPPPHPHSSNVSGSLPVHGRHDAAGVSL